MKSVVVVDTGIFLSHIEHPKGEADADRVSEKTTELDQDGAELILPIGSILETGKHVDLLLDGHLRRECALSFVTLLRAVLENRVPWRFIPLEWNEALLEQTIASEHYEYVAEATNEGLSLTDLSILAQSLMLQELVHRSGRRVHVWTTEARMRDVALDVGLQVVDWASSG